MDNFIFTLKNVLPHLTRLIGLNVKEKSPNSNHDISRGRNAAKKEEVISDVNIIIRLKNKNQLDVTSYFISLLMCSTCVGH